MACLGHVHTAVEYIADGALVLTDDDIPRQHMNSDTEQDKTKQNTRSAMYVFGGTIYEKDHALKPSIVASWS
jgi:hypothetical protein